MSSHMTATSPVQYYRQCRESGMTVSEATAEVAHSFGRHWATQSDYQAQLADAEARLQAERV